MEEIWKDIKGYEGLYQISNIGNVKSLKKWTVNEGKYINRERILKPTDNGHGYLIIGLRKNKVRQNCYIHRLVAEHFVKKKQEGLVINHIDYNTKNNVSNNLEWCTQKQNVRHSICNMKGVSHNIKNQNYGITYRKKQDNYELAIKKIYYGKYETLEEARKKRDDILNELNIAR